MITNMMRSSKIFISLFAGTILTALLIQSILGLDLPKWFPFSSQRSLNEWENKIFKGKVIYRVKHSGPEGYLQALSIGSASAIFYRIKNRYKAMDYPMISWKWKIIKFPDKNKLKTRMGIEKDDYAGRVYVIFPSLNFFASKALEYVWDESAPLETIWTSPYSKNIKLLVVHSGKEESGKWVFEERNIFRDYQRAFARKPNLKVGAIALMSDADNSGDVSEAYFDEIYIGYKEKR